MKYYCQRTIILEIVILYKGTRFFFHRKKSKSDVIILNDSKSKSTHFYTRKKFCIFIFLNILIGTFYIWQTTTFQVYTWDSVIVNYRWLKIEQGSILKVLFTFWIIRWLLHVIRILPDIENRTLRPCDSQQKDTQKHCPVVYVTCKLTSHFSSDFLLNRKSRWRFFWKFIARKVGDCATAAKTFLASCLLSASKQQPVFSKVGTEMTSDLVVLLSERVW